MATWGDVKGFLINNCDAKEEKNGLMSMVISYKDGRNQLVVVCRREVNGADWIDISSPVGTLNSGTVEVALEVLSNADCGGLVKIGDTHAVRHCIPIADLSNEELVGPLGIVASVADILEERLIGGDNL